MTQRSDKVILFFLRSIWRSRPDTARLAVRTLGAAAAIAAAYFLASRLGLALRLAHSDVAVFWPASGIAAGILIVFGRRAVPALFIGVVVGTIAASLLGGRGPLTSLFNGTWNAGEALLAAWLLEQWFGRFFTFGNLGRIAGFVVAAGIAATASAIAGAATLTLLHTVTTAPYWNVWREWFLSCWVGMVVLAPLVIEAAQMWRKPPPRKEWIEGVGVLGLTAVACSYTMTQATGSWLSFTALVFPLLLWLTARCQPAFGIAGAFIASVEIILATTFGIGGFGDAAVPITQRVAGAQVAMMTVTLFTLVLAVLFAQRKEAEERLAKERAMLARLHAVGSRLWVKRDLRQALDEILAGAIELLGADMGAIRILDTERSVLKIEAQRGFKQQYLDCFGEVAAEGVSPCCRAAQSAERIVIEDVEADALFIPFRPVARAAGYRALQSTPIMNREGMLLGTVATHFRSVHEPDKQDLRLFDLYVRQAAEIIERHRAEDVLRESEERLRLAQLKTGVGVWERDLLTGKLTLTPEHEALFGLKLGSMKRYADFRAQVHPDDISAYEAERDAAVLRRATFEAEYRIIRPDGQVRWLATRGGAFYDEVTGEPIRLVGNDADITERKQAELALAERNAQLALVGRAALVGSFTFDFKKGEMRISEGYAVIHGLPQGTTETTRRELWDRMHPDDIERLDALRSQTFSDRRGEYNVEYRIVLPNRGVRWIESRSFISYDGDGNAQRVVGINIDVTERKQTEARLSDALAAGQVVAFEWNAVTGRSQRSENAADILGSDYGPVASSRGSVFLEHIHLDDRASLKTRIRELCASDPSYAQSFRYVRPDGRQVWLEEVAKGEFDEAGKLLRIRGLTRDITERKCAEKRQRVLVAELDHRVKNMLATVSAIASRTQETSSSMAAYVAALDGRIKSMATAHELLSSRHWQGIPLAELVRRELAPYATAGNTMIEGPDVVLSAEPGQTLAMVLHELAANAAKFGAISVNSGRVCVRWSLMRNGHTESRLCIQWEESGGPRVVPPTRSGFGTSFIRELIPYELGGSVELMHSAEGVRANLEIPAHWLAE